MTRTDTLHALTKLSEKAAHMLALGPGLSGEEPPNGISMTLTVAELRALAAAPGLLDGEGRAKSHNRLVDILRAIDGYDWRGAAKPMPLDEFLSSIRAEAMAGCREIASAVDEEDAASCRSTPNDEAGIKPASQPSTPNDE